MDIPAAGVQSLVVLATLGDLIEDVVVRVAEPVNVASDTEAVVERRRGGSAANVAATAAMLGHRVRFLGQVGDDALGASLLGRLEDGGVDTSFVRRAGSTGTIVVLVDATGERTMLTDRRSCVDLRDPAPDWLDGVTTLHVPLYSFAGGPLADTATTLVAWAHERDVDVAIDLSSTTLLRALGRERVVELLRSLRPAAVFANRDEADRVGLRHLPTDAVVVVKDGAHPAVLRVPIPDSPGSVESLVIPPIGIERVEDTTGAGDAFAAGFLTSRDWRTESAEACVWGHRAAHRILTGHRP